MLRREKVSGCCQPAPWLWVLPAICSFCPELNSTVHCLPQKCLFSYFCLAGKGWQRWTKPLKMQKREQRGEMMDGAGRLFLATASICCSLSFLDKLLVVDCIITQLRLPWSGVWWWLFTCCSVLCTVQLSCFSGFVCSVRWLLRYINWCSMFTK